MVPNKDLEWVKEHYPPTQLKKIVEEVLSTLSKVADNPETDALLKEKVMFAIKVLNFNEKESKLRELKVAFEKFLATIVV